MFMAVCLVRSCEQGLGGLGLRLRKFCGTAAAYGFHKSIGKPRTGEAELEKVGG